MSKDVLSIEQMLDPELDRPDFNVDWQLDPGPYVEHDQVALDVGRTQRLLRIAGFGGLVVVGYQGEQTQISSASSSVTGMNEDGSATGSASTTVTKAETYSASYHRRKEDLGLAHANQWPIARAALNKTEMASQISDMVIRGKTKEVAVAGVYDQALRRAIGSAATQRLRGEVRQDLRTSIKGVLWAAVPSTFAAERLAEGRPDLAAFDLGAVGIAQGIFLMREKLINRRADKEDISPRHWSVFPGSAQLDRFALARTVLATQRLVRSR